MPTYLIFLNWTDQGIRAVKDSPKRLDATKKMVKDFGGEVRAGYLTQGQYDFLLVVEIPDDEKLAALVLRVGSLGNVRTTTLRAYTEAEYRKIIGGLG
jgi:uncharacterized protein with GYD domain